MRTTININDALLHQLKEFAHSEKKPLTRVVNEVIQRGLQAKPHNTNTPDIKLPTYSVGIKPVYKSTSLNQIYDQLETEDFLKVAET